MSIFHLRIRRRTIGKVTLCHLREFQWYNAMFVNKVINCVLCKHIVTRCIVRNTKSNLLQTSQICSEIFQDLLNRSILAILLVHREHLYICQQTLLTGCLRAIDGWRPNEEKKESEALKIETAGCNVRASFKYATFETTCSFIDLFIRYRERFC